MGSRRDLDPRTKPFRAHRRVDVRRLTMRAALKTAKVAGRLQLVRRVDQFIEPVVEVHASSGRLRQSAERSA